MVTASYAGAPRINMPVAAALFGSESAFPPVAWFERIVNNALSNFWARSVKAETLSRVLGVVGANAGRPRDEKK
jgi:hypothetical protein